MQEEMHSDPQPRPNVDQLHDAFAQSRDGVSGTEIHDEEQQRCHEQAVAQMATYVSMLRDTATAYRPDGRLRRPFSFKLELADGRWSIDEKELDATPQVGDIVSFDDGRSWRVRTSQFVRTRPSQKPVREFFVCAPLV